SLPMEKSNWSWKNQYRKKQLKLKQERTKKGRQLSKI
ncbi:hypothetical protein GCK32_010199, partial [Trichostrongylus colubriformis]